MNVVKIEDSEDRDFWESLLPPSSPTGADDDGASPNPILEHAKESTTSEIASTDQRPKRKAVGLCENIKSSSIRRPRLHCDAKQEAGRKCSYYESQWKEMYNRLVLYKKKYGHTSVPRGWKEDPQLGEWVKTQRCRCKDEDRIDLLDKIGFDWIGVRSEATWMEMYDRLLAYKVKYGNTSVPKGWKEDPKLANWVTWQRLYCKKQDRIDLLDMISFDWIVCSQRRDQKSWMEMYGRLLAYKEKHGTTCVPYRWKEDPKLGKWVQRQRKQCKDQDRISLLNKIGFCWQMQVQNSWIEMYRRLVAYKKKHGTTCVPQKWKEDPKLGEWVHHQRQVCKEQDRISLLNKIGFCWQMRGQRVFRTDGNMITSLHIG